MCVYIRFRVRVIVMIQYVRHRTHISRRIIYGIRTRSRIHIRTRVRNRLIIRVRSRRHVRIRQRYSHSARARLIVINVCVGFVAVLPLLS